VGLWQGPGPGGRWYGVGPPRLWARRRVARGCPLRVLGSAWATLLLLEPPGFARQAHCCHPLHPRRALAYHGVWGSLVADLPSCPRLLGRGWEGVEVAWVVEAKAVVGVGVVVVGVVVVVAVVVAVVVVVVVGEGLEVGLAVVVVVVVGVLVGLGLVVRVVGVHPVAVMEEEEEGGVEGVKEVEVVGVKEVAVVVVVAVVAVVVLVGAGVVVAEVVEMVGGLAVVQEEVVVEVAVEALAQGASGAPGPLALVL
jgi:hypothetical protein